MRESILLFGGEERLEGLGRMGTRIHQSPGPFVQLLFLPRFPHLSKWKQNFPSCLRGCGRTAFNKLIWWQKVWERGETGMRVAAKTSGDDLMHLYSVSTRGAASWVNERVGIYFSLRGLWNIPGATPHPLNHMHRHFCLDDTQNHESRGMDFLTYRRPFSDYNSGTQIFASRPLLRDLKTMHLLWKALHPYPSLQRRDGSTH